MSPPTTWGPPVWTLFHTLAEKITDIGYHSIGNQLFNHIYRICNSLPCPDCAYHATRFLAKIKPNTLKNKTDLKNMLYIFHNVVNAKKRKPIFHTDFLKRYENAILNQVYNNFIKVYNTRGNMKLLTESFQRDRVLKEFRQWFLSNYKYFVPIPQSRLVVAPTSLPEPPLQENVLAKNALAELQQQQISLIIEEQSRLVTPTIDEPVAEPLVEPVSEPLVEPVAEPLVEPLVEPVSEPLVEPVAEPLPEPVCDPVSEPLVEPVAEPLPEPVCDPVNNATIANEIISFADPVNVIDFTCETND